MTTKARAPKRTFTETKDGRVGTLTVGKLTASFVRTGDEVADVTFDGMGPSDHATMLGIVIQSAAVRWSAFCDLFEAIKDNHSERGRADGELLFDLGKISKKNGAVEIEIEIATAEQPECYATIVLRVSDGTIGLKCTAEPMEPAQLWALGSLLVECRHVMTDVEIGVGDLAQFITDHFTKTLGAESLKIALAEDEDDL